MSLIIYTAILINGVACDPYWQNIGGTGSGVVCIAAALLPNNRLFCYERPHMPPYSQNANTNGVLATEINLKAKVNSDGSWVSSFETKPIENNPFCSGLSTLADGSILVVGGDNQSWPLNSPNSVVVNGRKGMRTYTPCSFQNGTSCTSGAWKVLPEMTTERWYPTVVTLTDGSAIIIGGQTKNIDFDNLRATDNNPTYEYYPPKSGQWPKRLEILDWSFPHNLYPPAFLLPSGKVFVVVSNRTILIDPKTDVVTSLPDLVIPQDHSPWIYPHSPTAFVLPLTIANNFTFTMMMCGGSKLSSKDASAACVQINPDDPDPQWKQVADMPNPRLMPDSVILPDGTVLMVNGLTRGQAGERLNLEEDLTLIGGNQGQVQYASGPIYATDLFNPVTGKWSTVGEATNMRLYHSGALLLESGHVITVGSEMDNYNDFYNPQKPECFEDVRNINTNPTFANGCTNPFNYNIERFTPSYLREKAGVQINNAPTAVTYGSLIAVQVDSAKNVGRVSFVRTSAITHSTNTDQRYIELVIKSYSPSLNTLYIQIPNNAGLAPPGTWFLFAINSEGVPSVAATMTLTSGDPTSVTITGDAVTGSPTTAPNNGSESLVNQSTLLSILIAFLSSFF